ncbi:PREDICTED: zinc finger protein GIS2-like [Polistes canadensis]|uniref:zinc finger protein GIS2-like n=1 Tax=Polistes canadensis TaxID=91411 RepID=UPI000718BF9D|nr:PREDICTED: zinc finger protein GIS2-like [Polistes canadensis]
MSILRFDRQIKDDKKRNSSPTFGSRVANIRQIKENIVCEHCHKPGHKGGDCFRKAVCDYCQKQGHTEGKCFKRRQDNSNKSGRTSPNNSKSQTKTGYKSPKKCSYCKNLGHIIFDCLKLKYQLEKRSQGNGVRGTMNDARRSPSPKQRPQSPNP